MLAAACDQFSSGSSDEADQEKTTQQPIEGPGEATSSPATHEPFEGVIRLQVHRPIARTVDLFTYQISRDRVLYERRPADGSTAGPARALLDLAANAAYVLDDEQKLYMTLAEGTAPQKGLKDEVQVAKTGKTEEIEGHMTELWLFTLANGDLLDAWVIPDTPYFVLAQGEKTPPTEPDWASMLTRERVFPLRLIHRNKRGDVILWAAVKSVEPKKVDEGELAIPPEYRKIEFRPGVRLPGIG